MTTLFMILLGVGVLYAIVILIGNGIAHFDIPGIDLDLDHGGHFELGGEVKIPSLSPVALATFVTAFGAFGLIGEWFSNQSVIVSLLSAVVGGLIVATLAHLAFIYFLIKPQGSSEVTNRDVIGAEAEVITPIPADSVGEIALVAQGGRMTCPAKSASGSAIARNTTVVVERLVGGIAFVRPQ